MKITRSRLKQIIKEEMSALLGEEAYDKASFERAKKLPAIIAILTAKVNTLKFEDAEVIAIEIYSSTGGNEQKAARMAQFVGNHIIKVAGDIKDGRKVHLAAKGVVAHLKSKSKKTKRAQVATAPAKPAAAPAKPAAKPVDDPAVLQRQIVKAKDKCKRMRAKGQNISICNQQVALLKRRLEKASQTATQTQRLPPEEH